MEHEWSIADLQRLLQTGELSSVDLVEYYLERIASLDQSGPKVNAIIEVNPQAREIGRLLDEERRHGVIRGALHGIPIVLKDNIDTNDRLTTTAGSLALEGSIRSKDAFLVERLRQSGALILAKANLSEWANFRSTHSSSGWSSRGGQTHNPYALDRSPCGSSSGSAAAVAANLCAGAVGTETDGSIVCPAHANGIVGVKPTLGLVSRNGVIPISHSQDTAGPLTRSVEDAAILLSCLAGYDPLDPATNPLQNEPIPAYRDHLKMNGLRGARIGIARIFFEFDSRVDRIIENSIKVIRDLGAAIVDPVDLINPAKYVRSEIDVLLFDFKSDLDQYLASLAPDALVKNMGDLIQFNEKNKDRVMPFFGQERMLAAQSKGPLTSKQYLRSLERARRMAGAQGIDAALQKNNLDAIVAPSGNPAWLIDLVNGDQAGGPDTSSPPAVAGYPHITVPAGYVFGLPVGVSFIGSAWSEQKLLCLAYAFEQASNVRQPPQYLPTVDFSRE